MNTSNNDGSANFSPTDWDFTAYTSEELENGIEIALLKGTEPVAQRVALELIQMAKLLKCLAQTPTLDFPLRVKHTTELVPDFQLRSNERTVAVEVTRIPFEDVEHARSMQHRGIRSTLSVSSLYPKPSGRRNRRTILREGFGVKGFWFGLSAQEEEKAWLKQAKEILDAKTKVIARQDFIHGAEDWLVIVDPIGEQSEIERRCEIFSQLLVSYWKPGWFSRVFLQDNFFRWQIAFSQSQSAILYSQDHIPPSKILQQSFNINDSDARLFE